MKKRLSWVDYTRRNDPSQPFFVERLKAQLLKYGYPHVLCFWTKSPHLLATLYKDLIECMQRNDTLVLVQVTYNGYKELENVSEKNTDLTSLVSLIGSKNIRLRFDPIIPGYTTFSQFQNVVGIAEKFGIKRIITNFIVPEYKDVDKVLKETGVNILKITDEIKTKALEQMVDYCIVCNIELSGCAELNADGITNRVNGLIKAGCADMNWAIELKPELEGKFKLNSSRKGCLCCYDKDWGLYRSNGAPECIHQCKYCYAK